MNNGVKFSKHIAKVAVKGHRMANLILKCFLSRNISSLVRAFTTYVRPRLEYCSVDWNPVLKKDIENLEKVQRKFTKRLPGLQQLTYCQRLVRLQLESLELQRQRLLFTYKQIFGLIDLDVSDFFRLRCDNRNRGHQCKLFLPSSRSSVRHNFYTYRAARMWNDLPADSTNFSSLNRFKRSLTPSFLTRHSVVHFF